MITLTLIYMMISIKTVCVVFSLVFDTVTSLGINTNVTWPPSSCEGNVTDIDSCNATLTVTEDSDEDYSNVISSMMTRFGSPFLCVVLMEWNT